MEKIEYPSWEWEITIHDMLDSGILRRNVDLLELRIMLNEEYMLASNQTYYVDNINQLVPNEMNDDEKKEFLSRVKKVAKRVCVPDDFDKKLRKQYQE
ncbi:hypothetical protein [Lactobacillus mulieris]|uniref:Uncharacterized protein n=1 Tax=Lactobacillus mulieris TaxID=2508708 RepID=A0AAW5WWS7_9LACO|nr:hypothetical protein [Lactobacillus mulieris]MCZ3621397.1 hypothetical protein [Lactobacillus mulieris]MCZ3623327.1 hypothetical protein [Lactobacillus mulieris]MCZ3635404.1 hypothetical protein [Lactobacillus mulieris]MCZ3689488.1 hypothetical protein [Lactobacillus mulieris]MCZ3695491.1 hypothetical protein [Lactobacillus mulieris]